MVKYKTDENGQVYIQDVIENEIILYSTGCPKCKILESKLQSKGVYYTKNTSVDEMMQLGFTNVPILKVNGEYLDFGKSIKWINEIKGA